MQSGVHDEYIQALSEAVSGLKQGDPLSEGVNQGCLINITARDKVQSG